MSDDDEAFVTGSPDDDDDVGDDVPEDPFHDDEAHRRRWVDRCDAVDRGDQCMHGLDHDGPHQAIHEWEDAATAEEGAG